MKGNIYFQFGAHEAENVKVYSGIDCLNCIRLEIDFRYCNEFNGPPKR